MQPYATPMRVGEIEIVPVMDGVARMPPTEAFRLGNVVEGAKGLNDEDWGAPPLPAGRRRHARAGARRIPYAGRPASDDRVVLVDTGVGDLQAGPFDGGRLLASLAAGGVQPGDVTDVVLTHLHFDHVGWTTTRHGEVVFTNAAYRCDQRDWDHFGRTRPRCHQEAHAHRRSAGTVGGRRTAAAPGSTRCPRPDHTPGSTVMVVSDDADRPYWSATAVHCPVELLDDEWSGIGDVDPELAIRTRVARAPRDRGQRHPGGSGPLSRLAVRPAARRRRQAPLGRRLTPVLDVERARAGDRAVGDNPAHVHH